MDDEGQERLPDRRLAVRRGAWRLLGLLTLGMPLAIVAAYHLAGWQVAVLLFPAQAIFAFLSAWLAGRKRRRTERTVLQTISAGVFFAGIVALPILAAVSGSVGSMRAWAYLTAIPFALMLASDRNGASTTTAGMIALPDEWVRFVHAAKWGAVAVLFVGGSEAIWLTSSLGVWIWYHAFAVPIFFSLMLLVQQALVAFFGRPPNLTTEIEPPPKSPGDESPELASVFHRGAAGLNLSYGKVSLSQAQNIVSAIREEEIALRGFERGKAPVPHFLVWSEDASGVTIYRDGKDTIGIRWHYLDAPRRTEFIGAGMHFAAASVPFDLISPIIAIAWDDDWDGMMELLRPYSPVDMVANQAGASYSPLS